MLERLMNSDRRGGDIVTVPHCSALSADSKFFQKFDNISEQKIFCTPQTFQLAKYVGEKADRLQKISPQNNLASIMNFLDLVPNVDVRDTLSIKMNVTLFHFEAWHFASSAMQYSCFQMLGKWWLPLEITICWSCNSFFQNDSHSREKQQYWKMSTGRDFSPTFPHAPILAKTGDSAPMSSSASFSRCRFIF